MTTDETKNHFENLRIDYRFAQSPFGKILIASTKKGLCSVLLAADENTAVESLRKIFPKARIQAGGKTEHLNTAALFSQTPSTFKAPLHLHLKGTPFQLQVWNALLKIPFGETTSYGDIAARIGRPKACRAVGSAVGSNPIFFLVPCHRVIQSTGAIGQYYWGSTVKTTILDWEKSASKENG